MRRGPAQQLQTPPFRTSKPARELLCCVYRYDVPSTHALELHYTVDEREKCVVIAPSDVTAGVDARASLTHQNPAGTDRLTSCALNTESVRVAVPTVSARASSFLMCHDLPVYRAGSGPGSGERDLVDPDLRKVLPVALLPPVPFPPLPLEDDDFLFAAVADDLGLDRRAVNDRRTDLHVVVTIAGEEDVVERHHIPRLHIQRGDAEADAGFSAKLLTACLKYRVHIVSSQSGSVFSIEPVNVEACIRAVKTSDVQESRRRA